MNCGRASLALQIPAICNYRVTPGHECRRDLAARPICCPKHAYIQSSASLLRERKPPRDASPLVSLFAAKLNLNFSIIHLLDGVVPFGRNDHVAIRLCESLRNDVQIETPC